MSSNKKLVGARFRRYDGQYLNGAGMAVTTDVLKARVFSVYMARLKVKYNNFFNKQRGRWELVYE